MSMKLSNQGLSSKEEFEKLIESIGFKSIGRYYYYKEFVIYLYANEYNFYNGSEWVYDIDLNDLRLIENYFKKELRTFKLKKILG